MPQKKTGVLKSGFPIKTTPPSADGDNAGRLFTAALLEAMMGKCDCNCCQIIRQIGTGLTSQLRKEVKDG